MKANEMLDVILTRLSEALIDAHTYREKNGDMLGDLRLKQIKIESLESRIRQQAHTINQLAQREPLPGEPPIDDIPF